MSSPLLQTLAEDSAPLLAAAATVAETSLFTYLDVLDATRFSSSAAALSDGWLHARLTFSGPAIGEFELSLPADLARRLCVAFTGDDPRAQPVAAVLTDFTAEMANMICGAWLTTACRQHSFDLTAACVTAGRAPRPAPSSPQSQSAYVAIDDSPVRLDVAIRN